MLTFHLLFLFYAGAMSSDDEGSDEGGAEDTQYGGYQLLVQDPEVH